MAEHTLPGGVGIHPLEAWMVPACAEIAKTAPDPWRPADFESLLGQAGRPCFVALQGETPLGFACFLAVCETADLQLVAVAPAFRAQGLGKALLLHGMAVLKQQGTQRVLLELRCGNAPALALYQSLGFQMLARRPGMYHNPPEDGFLMAKNLGEL